MNYIEPYILYYDYDFNKHKTEQAIGRAIRIRPSPIVEINAEINTEINAEKKLYDNKICHKSCKNKKISMLRDRKDLINKKF